MAAKDGDELSAAAVPDPGGSVAAGRRDLSAVRAEGGAPDGAGVTGQDVERPAAARVPDQRLPVVAGRDDARTVGAEDGGADGAARAQHVDAPAARARPRCAPSGRGLR